MERWSRGISVAVCAIFGEHRQSREEQAGIWREGGVHKQRTTAGMVSGGGLERGPRPGGVVSAIRPRAGPRVFSCDALAAVAGY